MKLKLDEKLEIKGKEIEFLEVNIWSFLKCNLLISLLMTGLYFGVLFILIMLLAVVGLFIP